MRSSLVALALVAFASPTFAAETARPPEIHAVGIFNPSNGLTDEGARALEDGYAAYFGRASIDKGVIAIAVDGDGYKVTWDLQKALDAGGAPADTGQIGPFSYRLKPEAGGGWSWTSDSFPSVVFDTTNDKEPAKGQFDVEGFALAGHFDPGAEPFLVNKIALGALKGDITETDPTGVNHIKFVERDLSAETRAQTNSAGGVDVAVVHAAGKLEQIVTPPGGEPGGDLDVKVLANGSAGGAAITGLRAKEIGALWRALAAGANDGKAPDALAALVTAALPLWKDLSFDLRMNDMSVGSSMGSAGLGGFGERFKLSGLDDDGRLEFGFDIDALKFDSPLAPAWVSQLSPLSAKFQLALTDHGVGEAARLALKDPKFGQNAGDFTPETQEAINQAIKAGDPTLVMLPGRLTTPIIDLTFEGSARIQTDAPSAHMKFSADGLDKLVALATELGKADPEIQSGVLALSLIKGLAKTGPDGRLAWDVVLDGENLTVNGSPLPIGK